MKTSLRQFIQAHNLTPDDGGLGLDWFRPDEMFLVEIQKWGSDKLYIFTDPTGNLGGANQCAILSTGTRSELFNEDELADFIARESWLGVSDASGEIIKIACSDCRDLVEPTIECPDGGDIELIIPKIGMKCFRCGWEVY